LRERWDMSWGDLKDKGYKGSPQGRPWLKGIFGGEGFLGGDPKKGLVPKGYKGRKNPGRVGPQLKGGGG